MKKLVAILLISAGALRAQNAKEDFKHINEKYQALEKMSMNVSYELFFDNDKLCSDKEEGFYKRDKNQYYVKQAGGEMLITTKHTIIVDNDSKTVIVDRSQGKTEAINPLSMDLDSILHFYKKIEFYKTGANNALSAYAFTLKDGPYTNIDVIFDPATLLVKEIINTYREKMPDQQNKLRTARLKTSFTQHQAGAASATDFNTAKYVVSSNNKLKLTKKYTGYKLLTNLKNL